MIVDAVEKRRPGAIVVVSADHGEEFGDHGGRYHGTTVYEEQVRVPLVVVAPGVAAERHLDARADDRSAADDARRARRAAARARSAGATSAACSRERPRRATRASRSPRPTTTRWSRAATNGSFACGRLHPARSSTCAPTRSRRGPIADRPERVKELRRLTAAIERENGKLEASALPEALRRGLQGDRDAAEDVATLFDDARVDIRREAARCAFRLKAPVMAPQLRRALAKDEDAEVRKWSGLALARLGGPGAGTGTAEAGGADGLLHDPSAPLRYAAALVAGGAG